MGMEQAALGLFAQNQYRDLLACGMDGRLQSGRTGSQNDDIALAFYFLHIGFSSLGFRFEPDLIQAAVIISSR